MQLESFRTSGVSTARGATELAGLELAYSVGNVHPDSSRTVFDVHKVKMLKCVALPVPTPPHPPYTTETSVTAIMPDRTICIVVVTVPAAPLDVLNALREKIGWRMSQWCLELVQGTCTIGPLDEIDPAEWLQVLRSLPNPEPDVESHWCTAWVPD